VFIINGDNGIIINNGCDVKCSEHKEFNELSPGEYSMTLCTPEDWLIKDVNINDDNSSYVISYDARCVTVTCRVEPGETVDVMFNVYRRKVTVNLSAGIGNRITSPGEGEFEYCIGTTICIDAEPMDPLFEFVGWRGSFYANVPPDCNDPLIEGLTNTCGVIAEGVIVPPCTRGCTTIRLIQNYYIKAVCLSRLDTLYVDDDGPSDPVPFDNTMSDPNENGTPEHPFDMIQEAIEVAKQGATVIVQEGHYPEMIDFMGKCITVTGLDPDGSGVPCDFPVIEGPAEKDAGHVVTFNNCDDPNTTLTGFVITGGYGLFAGAINCNNSSPTIQHCLIIGNRSTSPQGSGAAVYCIDSKPVFANCTICSNHGGSHGAGVYSVNSEVVILDSILYDNSPEEIMIGEGLAPIVSYCDVAGGYSGEGNIDEDPLFKLSGFWAHSLNPGMTAHPENLYAVWTYGNYHLQSGSPCVDAGDPSMPCHCEPEPNGGRLNMGAYGSTNQATTSPTP
jgi:hypothetical protein